MTNFIPGYRLHHAAKRASIQFQAAPCLVGSLADHNPSHYRFPRVQTDKTPLEKTGPAIEPMWHSWLAGALTLFAIAVVVVVL